MSEISWWPTLLVHCEQFAVEEPFAELRAISPVGVKLRTSKRLAISNTRSSSAGRILEAGKPLP